MSHVPSPNGAFSIFREAERAAQNAEGKRAMFFNQIALGCMVAMALPCVLQSFAAVFRSIDSLTHAQRVKHERLEHRLDDHDRAR